MHFFKQMNYVDTQAVCDRLVIWLVECVQSESGAYQS